LLQADVPAEVRLALQVVPCQRLEDVLQAAFDPPITLQQQQSLLARL
jgi:ATP-dependent Lon protease